MSVYDLQIEDKTAFGRWFTPGQCTIKSFEYNITQEKIVTMELILKGVYPLPSEEDGARMYRKAFEVLGQAGYEHYEVSNYALPTYQSRHNMKYWACEPVWGFGLSAASYIRGQREVRPSSMPEYQSFVNSLSR